MRTVIEAILKQQTRIMENVHETTRAFQTTLAYNQMQMTALMEFVGKCHQAISGRIRPSDQLG